MDATTNGHDLTERQAVLNAVILEERLLQLEQTLYSADWRQLTIDSEQEFSRQGLRDITELARLMYLKNPLIQRGVKVKADYVWGQGVSIKAAMDEVNGVVQAFLDDEDNRAELTGHQARIMKERELETDGNLFLVLFTDTIAGRVRVRSIPFAEIDDIIRNPDDNKDPWFYRRVWTEETFDMTTGATMTKTRTAWYPSWRYDPTAKPQTIGGHPVVWSAPVFHIRVGGFSDWKFGVSEVYAAIDWAKAYKEFLEDWASIVRAYRRFAWELKTPGGKRGIAAAKSKLNTTLGTNDTETNPPPLTGSTFISGGDASLKPLSGGPSVSADDGRRLLLMTAAALGLPETFFGDVSVGTLATAKSLDRPTELAMIDRQTLWEDVLQSLLAYVVRVAIKAGALTGVGTVRRTVEDGRYRETVEPIGDANLHVDIDFPPLVTRDVQQGVDAIVKADQTGKLRNVDVARMLLVALGENDIDEIMALMFDDEGNRIDQPDTRPADQMAEAVRDLRESLVALRSNDRSGVID